MFKGKCMIQESLFSQIINKKCSKCGEWKLLNEFYKSKTNKDGLCGSCKKCNYKQGRNWIKNNLEKVNGYKKKYCKNNPEKIRESSRKWARKQYKENPEKIRNNSKKWRKNNSNKVKEAKKNIEKII